MGHAEYYSYTVNYSGRLRHLIWCSNDKDRVLIDDDGSLAWFDSLASLQAFVTTELDISIQTAGNALDLDMVAQWCDHPTADTLDCVLLLDAWNLFTDIETSISEHRSHFGGRAKAFDGLYEKLFFGCNLSAVSPLGARYVPHWSEKELSQIADILSGGLAEFGRLC